MKKLLTILAGLLLSFGSAHAIIETDTITREAKIQQDISEISFKMLNASRIDKIIPIRYETRDKTVNAYTWNFHTTFVIIPKGIVRFFETDDELAAVVAHELSHGITASEGFSKRLATNFRPKTYEYRADKQGVDLMVKAGYNPLAMIVAFAKILPQAYYETPFSTHPKTSKRMATIYEYIYTKYPQYLANNAYKDNIYYQNFLLTSKENRKRFEAKANDPTQKVRYK